MTSEQKRSQMSVKVLLSMLNFNLWNICPKVSVRLTPKRGPHPEKRCAILRLRKAVLTSSKGPPVLRCTCTQKLTAFWGAHSSVDPQECPEEKTGLWKFSANMTALKYGRTSA